MHLRHRLSLAFEDPDVGKLRTVAHEAIGVMRGRDFGWKAFWDSNPEWSCLKLTLDQSLWNLRGFLAWGQCGPCLSLWVVLWHWPYSWGKAWKKRRVVEKCKLGTIQCVNMAALRVAKTSCRSRTPSFRWPGSTLGQSRYLPSYTVPLRLALHQFMNSSLGCDTTRFTRHHTLGRKPSAHARLTVGTSIFNWKSVTADLCAQSQLS